MAAKTALIYSDAWTRFDYGPQHPLRMERLGLTWRLMQAYGLSTLPGATVRAPEPAPESALASYHDGEYLEMLKACNGGQAPMGAERFGLGPGDNPVFPGLWDAARLCAAGSILAADLVLSGGADRVFRGRTDFDRIASSRRHDADKDAVAQLHKLVLPYAGNVQER